MIDGGSPSYTMVCAIIDGGDGSVDESTSPFVSCVRTAAGRYNVSYPFTFIGLPYCHITPVSNSVALSHSLINQATPSLAEVSIFNLNGLNVDPDFFYITLIGF